MWAASGPHQSHVPVEDSQLIKIKIGNHNNVYFNIKTLPVPVPAHADLRFSLILAQHVPIGYIVRKMNNDHIQRASASINKTNLNKLTQN